MAQTPVTTYSDECTIDYTPAAAVTAGAVIVLGGIVGIATSDIAISTLGSLSIEGVKKVPKTTAAWTAFAPVFWNATGDPDGGTAGSGAANQLGVGTRMGYASIAAGSGDDYGYVVLNEVTNSMPVSAVTAAGSLISDAAALYQGLNIVTGADGTKGVILPVAVAGMPPVYVKGVTAGVLKVWPQSGATINALSASAALSLASGATPAIFVASSATQWYTIPLLPS